jgi:hypothetical protein
MQIDSPDAVDELVFDACTHMNHRADALARIEYLRDHFLDMHENPRFASREKIVQRFDRHLDMLQR